MERQQRVRAMHMTESMVNLLEIGLHTNVAVINFSASVLFCLFFSPFLCPFRSNERMLSMWIFFFRHLFFPVRLFGDWLQFERNGRGKKTRNNMKRACSRPHFDHLKSLLRWHFTTYIDNYIGRNACRSPRNWSLIKGLSFAANKWETTTTTTVTKVVDCSAFKLERKQQAKKKKN